MNRDIAARRNATLFDWRFVACILAKTLLFFIIMNIAFAVVDPLPLLGQLSLYNSVFPGRLRLPYGADPNRAYNLNIDQLQAMFSSHEISGTVKYDDEYRILILGDSSVWGFLLEADQTLAEVINKSDWQTHDGRKIRALNLGYPTMSVLKDLLLLDHGLQFNPDMIIWFITLESLVYEEQLETPLIRFNPESSRSLIERFDLSFNDQDARYREQSFWDKTIVGSRRTIADIARLQILGALWASTRVDHVIPEVVDPSLSALQAQDSFHEIKQGEMRLADLAFEVLDAGIEVAAGIPLIMVNEPIFIFEESQSAKRYNTYYPRWAYDRYRELLVGNAQLSNWDLLDAWDVLQNVEFADQGIHYSARGADTLAAYLKDEIIERADRP
jgi:hypothetical protein